MKTQLLVTVKDANFVTKMYSSLLWFIEIFKKSKISIWIDSTDTAPITLTARSKPYEVELTPGTHTIYIDDPKRASRTRLTALGNNLVLGAAGMGMGMASGGLTGAAIGAAIATGGKRAEVRENVLCCTLADGDELAITVTPLFKKVKIKVEN